MSKKSNAVSKLVQEVPASPQLSTADKERQRRYEVEDGLRTLTRAREIMQDAQLMKEIRAYVNEQQKVVAKKK